MFLQPRPIFNKTFRVRRPLYFLTGWLSLGLGIAGLILPVLPGTCFILLSAFCFSKSSPRFHDWLVYRSRFGPMIQDWYEHRMIKKSVKKRATFWIAIAFTVSIFMTRNIWPLATGLGLFGVWLLYFIWKQKSEPEVKSDLKVQTV